MKTVNIGLIGFGTVGCGVHKLLEKNNNLIKRRTGIDVRLKSICDLRIQEIKCQINNVNLTERWLDIIEDDEIDTVVELIGGLEPAKTIIIESLNKNKNIVTANKMLLALEGDEIFKKASTSSSQLGFEASVGGGIPCILSLKNGLIGNRINSIIGILNGTTNYILTRMEEDGLPFNEAVIDAQDKGFAEADPTFDIEGFDAGHKIDILSMLAYNRKIDYNFILIEGITKINEIDIIYAREMGYVIKLLGISKLIGDEVDIRVHPTMLSIKHPLSSVRDEFNAIMFISDMTGPVILYGKGAGSHPTASAVMSDIVQIASKESISENLYAISPDVKYLSPDKRISRYYLRFNTEDRPGILSKISGVLAKYNISIASVIQKAINKCYVPIVLITHKADEDSVMNAVKDINRFNFIDGSVTLIRIEDSYSFGESYE